MNMSVFVLTVFLACALFTLNDSAVIKPVELNFDNETQAFNTSFDYPSYDFVFPDDPIFRNITLLIAEIFETLNSTGNLTSDEENRIGRNVIRTIVG